MGHDGALQSFSPVTAAAALTTSPWGATDRFAGAETAVLSHFLLLRGGWAREWGKKWRHPAICTKSVTFGVNPNAPCRCDGL
ncbi:MAG TPA: hypothetical protein DEA72_10295 [Halomonas campaniensis]|nr:hypothetical protein [Halomonas campaniensis]